MTKKKKRYSPKSFPKAMQDLVTIDYLEKLSTDEIEWLASFNEAEYGDNPQFLEEITGIPVTQDEKRAAWRKNNTRRYDTLAQKVRLDINREEDDYQNQFKSETEIFSLDSKTINQEDIIITLIDKGPNGKAKC